MHPSRRQLLAALAVLPIHRLAGQAPSPADEPPSAAAPSFSTTVNVVNVFMTVRDKKGQIVRDLTVQDFSIAEDERPQVIRYFSKESDLPLTLGLLVDTSLSQRRVLKDEQDASYRFFDQVLRQDRDQAFVIHFDAEVEMLQDLTPSRDKLQKAIDQLQIGTGRRNQPTDGGGNSGGNYPGGGYPGGQYPRRGGGYPGGGRRVGTELYDAILLASDEVTRNQKGRKAIVLLSDGVDSGSKTTLFRAIESAQKADTLVYSILFGNPEGSARPPVGFGGPGMGRGRRGGMGYPRPGGEARPDGKKVLEQISRETGGRFFQVTGKMPIDKVFSEIEEDLRNEYSLGYISDQAAGGSAYRRIRVTTKKKDLVVQAREGYYPPT